MAYDNSNIFAKIIRGEIPTKKLYEDEYVIAIEDIEPAAPTHILVIPKGDYSSFDDFSQNASPETIARFFTTIQKLAKQFGIDKSGYRLITNHGQDASQSVAHFHVHLLGGKQLGKLLPDA
jgi:histidine triad (HIT) family protein